MVKIRQMIKSDIEIIAKAFQEQGWHKTSEQYETYFEEQSMGKRVVLIAETEGVFSGYLTIEKDSEYTCFRERQIPEITDLNVLKKYQKRGLATLLIGKAEDIIKSLSDVVGIRVGLLKDYGSAQRLYVKLGYIPDGLGISKDNYFYGYYEEVLVDDDLVMGLIKVLN